MYMYNIIQIYSNINEVGSKAFHDYSRKTVFYVKSSGQNVVPYHINYSA